jgi:hypothetical protein
MSDDEVRAMTESIRDMVGTAGLVMGRRAEAFREFDEWFAAVSGGSAESTD